MAQVKAIIARRECRARAIEEIEEELTVVWPKIRKESLLN